MLDPVGAFLVGRAELAGVWGVGALGDESLEDFGVPKFVALLEEAPGLREVFGVVLEDEEAFAGNVRGGGVIDFAAHAVERADAVSAFRVGGLVWSEVVEDDQAAPAEVVASLQGFAVEPFHFGREIGGAEGFEDGAELVFDGEALALAVPHSAGGGVDECAPAVDFGFVGPLAALGAGDGERATVGGAERVAWDHLTR